MFGRSEIRPILSHWHWVPSFICLALLLHFYRTLLKYPSPSITETISGSLADLDNNGIPDYCTYDEGGTRCITSEGVVITVKTDPGLPTGTLPLGKQFEYDNGTRWKVEYVGNISFTGDLGEKNLVGDKCRSSLLSNKVIWNCGDMWCDFDYTICGFAMGPAMYGTEDVMTINATGITHIYDNEFLRPWSGDPEPESPYRFWGIDTSNVAAINETHGVAYGFEVWRGTGTDLRRGNCVASITLGEDMPIATRVGPLLTGPDTIEMGMLAILRAGDYIYIYSAGGPSRLIVTRVLATDDVFDASQYETLELNTNSWSRTIPMPSTKKYGMVTANRSRKFGCLVYGSVFYSNYLNKYVIICNIYMVATNMYTSDTPWGPWSEEYGLLRGWRGYGSMVHPMYSPGGSHKEIYFSQGPNTGFDMFKVTFDYDL